MYPLTFEKGSKKKTFEKGSKQMTFEKGSKQMTFGKGSKKTLEEGDPFWFQTTFAKGCQHNSNPLRKGLFHLHVFAHHMAAAQCLIRMFKQ